MGEGRGEGRGGGENEFGAYLIDSVLVIKYQH